MASRGLLRHVLAATGCGLGAFTLAACSASAQGPQASSTVSSTAKAGASTSTPTSFGTSASASADSESPEAKAALAAYQGMVTDWVSAALTSNYQDPALAHHASGAALTYMTQQLFIQQTQKSVGKGTPRLLDIAFRQMTPAADPTQVVINSCFDDSAWLQYTTDGELFNDVPGGRHQAQVLVVENNGVWKVNQLVLDKVGTC
jgi:hypothetical protein